MTSLLIYLVINSNRKNGKAGKLAAGVVNLYEEHLQVFPRLWDLVRGICHGEVPKTVN